MSYTKIAQVSDEPLAKGSILKELIAEVAEEVIEEETQIERPKEQHPTVQPIKEFWDRYFQFRKNDYRKTRDFPLCYFRQQFDENGFSYIAWMEQFENNELDAVFVAEKIPRKEEDDEEEDDEEEDDEDEYCVSLKDYKEYWDEDYEYEEELEDEFVYLYVKRFDNPRDAKWEYSIKWEGDESGEKTGINTSSVFALMSCTTWERDD